MKQRTVHNFLYCMLWTLCYKKNNKTIFFSLLWTERTVVFHKCLNCVEFHNNHSEDCSNRIIENSRLFPSTVPPVVQDHWVLLVGKRNWRPLTLIEQTWKLTFIFLLGLVSVNCRFTLCSMLYQFYHFLFLCNILEHSRGNGLKCFSI